MKGKSKEKKPTSKGKKQQEKPKGKIDVESASPVQLWKHLLGEKTEMDEELFAHFFTQILKLPDDSPLQFYLLTTGMKSPKLGHITFDNFENLFKFSGNCKNVKQLKKLIPKMQKDLKQPKIFKQMYKSLFDVFLVKNLSMDFEYAQSLWSVLFKDFFVFRKEFDLYLQRLGNKKLTRCHKDLWEMMYEFAYYVKNPSVDYKVSDGWPVFLDSFVEFMKEEGFIK